MKQIRKKGRREAAVNPWTAQMIGIVSGFLLMVFLVFAGSLLVEKALIPERGIDAWVLASCVVGVFIGTVAASRGQKKKRGLRSLGASVFMILVLMIVGVVLWGELDLIWSATVSIACLAGGALSWVITKRKK